MRWVCGECLVSWDSFDGVACWVCERVGESVDGDLDLAAPMRWFAAEPTLPLPAGDTRHGTPDGHWVYGCPCCPCISAAFQQLQGLEVAA